MSNTTLVMLTLAGAITALSFVRKKESLKMNISQAGVDFIKKHEGLRLTEYKDQAGLSTIGYGHLNIPGAYYTEITEQQAENILRGDLAVAETAVRNAITRPMTQAQYDAFVSLAFNIGGANFRTSTAVKRFNAGDKVGAAEALTWWNKITDPSSGQKVVSNGLSFRRADERDLFLTGSYA